MAKLIRAMGTGPGIFRHFRDRVRIPVGIVGAGVGEWEFSYQDDELAKLACEHLQKSLEPSNEVAVQLANTYYVGFLAKYLLEFLPPEGLVSGYHNASLFFDGNRGLRQKWPNGSLAVNIEDVVNRDALEWKSTRRKVNSVSELGAMQAGMLHISPWSRWRAAGYIRDSRSPYDWLSDIVSVSCRVLDG